MRKMTEKCGVFAAVGPSMSAEQVKKGWGRLKHRGTDAVGLIRNNGQDASILHTRGSIEHLFSLLDTTEHHSLYLAHNRYITSGSENPENSQPILLENEELFIGLAHNGNLNQKAVELLQRLYDLPPNSDASDSYMMATVLLKARAQYSTWTETFTHVLPQFKGAFSLACTTEENVIYAARDPWSLHPLCLGIKNGAWIVASESVSLDSAGAEYVREVLPGELVRLTPDGQFSSLIYATNDSPSTPCLLETIYFAKNESVFDGATIREQRKALGRLAGEHFRAKGHQVDMVIPILNSGKQMTMGVAETFHVEHTEAIKVRGDERSFIQNTPQKRSTTVHEKHIVDGEAIQGKRIVLCDDSAVRGVSLLELLKKVKEHQPAEIHIVIGSEPVVDICDLGIDLPTQQELLTSKLIRQTPPNGNGPEYDAWLQEVEQQVAQILGVNSVTYLSRTSVERALKRTDKEMCRHCFGGEHPIEDAPSPTYRVDAASELREQKVLFMASGSGTNVENLLRSMEAEEILAQPIGVITNNPQAGVIDKAQKFEVSTTIVSSKGQLGTPEKRKHYEQELLHQILTAPAGLPDVIVLAGWMLVLSDDFLRPLVEHGIDIVNIHPALLSGKGRDTVKTSRGVIPELRGGHAIEDAANLPLPHMPVTGVTVHRVLPDHEVDTGTILVKEEVVRFSGESAEQLATRIHAAEYRIFPIALQIALLKRLQRERQAYG